MYYGNRYLSQEESDYNAQLFYSKMSNISFSLNAIAGMLGNIYKESGVNPGIWQNLNEGNMSGGFGLVQWTPATNYIDWAASQGFPSYDDYANLYLQCERIAYEFDNGLQYIETTDYPLSAKEFRSSTLTPEYLAEVFLRNYERAGIEVLEERKTWARYYYNLLSGTTPTPPDDDEPTTQKIKRKKFNFVLFNNRRKMQWTGMSS